MACVFDYCELINGLVLGLVSGVVACFAYDRLVRWHLLKKQREQFGYLASNGPDDFDWTCYSLKREDGRIREDAPNGSAATINHDKGNVLNIRLKQKDGRIWNGKLTMTDRYVGTLSFRYEKEHEYGFKDVFVGEESEGDKKYDYLFLLGKGKDYGNELIRRERTDN